MARIADFLKRWICQHLDDTAAACLRENSRLQVFNDTYARIVDQLSIQLAPRDDPDKAFGPSKNGTVFGTHYDMVSWTWGLPQEKLARFCLQARTILDATWCGKTKYRVWLDRHPQ